MRTSRAHSAVIRQHPRSIPSLPAAQRGSEYAQLSRQVRQAGLLERRCGYYIWKISATVVLLAAGWAAFVVAGDSWWQLAVAMFLAVMFTQVGFLGHDAGHRQIFASRRASYVLGVLLGNLGIGLSYNWWVDKHNGSHRAAVLHVDSSAERIAVPAQHACTVLPGVRHRHYLRSGSHGPIVSAMRASSQGR